MENYNRIVFHAGKPYEISTFSKVDDGLELVITTPEGLNVGCHYAKGELRSCLIARVDPAAASGGVVMMKTTYEPLSPEVREVAMGALNEFLASSRK
jgi:hypothetical protein